MNDKQNDENIETPCPLCAELGIYLKFLRFDLIDHLNRKHTKKWLAGFVGREAHYSRWWDTSEDACLQKNLNFEVKLFTEAFKILGSKKNDRVQGKQRTRNNSPRSTERRN